MDNQTDRAIANLDEYMAERTAALKPDSDKEQSRITYCQASSVTLKPIGWIWSQRIARGKLTMLAGNPGLGKSQLTTSLAAIVSIGGQWPADRTWW